MAWYSHHKTVPKKWIKTLFPHTMIIIIIKNVCELTLEYSITDGIGYGKRLINKDLKNTSKF